MPTYWWIAPGLVGLLGLLLVLGAFAALFRGRIFKSMRGLLGGGFLLALALAASLMALNVQSYARLTWEQPIATVSIAETGAGRYDVTVAETGLPAHVYPVEGDQWQLDARVITWKPWANILGLDAQYELQRLWGRHLQGPERNTASAVDLLAERPGIDMLDLSAKLGNLSPLQQREFGSAVYMPLVDGATYEVRITQKAIVADPRNGIAQAAVERGGLEERPPEQTEERSGGFRITLP